MPQAADKFPIKKRKFYISSNRSFVHKQNRDIYESHLLVDLIVYAYITNRIYMWKNALYLSVNVFGTKVLIEDTNFTSPTGDGTAILLSHPNHAKG